MSFSEAIACQRDIVAAKSRLLAVGSEVAHRVAPVLATVRRSNRACGFPAHGFHEDSNRDAIEGINLTRLTSPCSR